MNIEIPKSKHCEIFTCIVAFSYRKVFSIKQTFHKNDCMGNEYQVK